MFQDISVVEVIANEVGVPRNDGTRGSALYSVPFRLSGVAPAEWARFFIESWDHPERFTSMHCPGIASVHGDRIVLSRTTLEEVEQYHRSTLLLAVDKANASYKRLEGERRAQEERERQRVAEHKAHVEDAARRIRFDDPDDTSAGTQAP